MNLSGRDITGIAVQGIIAGIAGLLFGVGSLYADRRAGDALRVHTDALHLDRGLLSYCRELERRTSHLHSEVCVHYLQAVDSIDRLVKLRLQLQALPKPRVATMADAELGIQLVTRCKVSLRSLLEACRPLVSTREHCDLERLCERLYCNGVDPTMKAVTKMTKHAH